MVWNPLVVRNVEAWRLRGERFTTFKKNRLDGVAMLVMALVEDEGPEEAAGDVETGTEASDEIAEEAEGDTEAGSGEADVTGPSDEVIAEVVVGLLTVVLGVTIALFEVGLVWATEVGNVGFAMNALNLWNIPSARVI